MSFTKRIAIIALAILAAVLLVWKFPLFHLVPLEEAEKAKKQHTFDAAAAAKTYWNDQLLPALNHVASVEEVLELAATDPKQVRSKFGHSVGSSRSYFLFLHGTGRIVAINKHDLRVQLAVDGPSQEVLLDTGPLTGNTVRDAAGLLNPSNFTNSQQFNNLSIELNNIVESQVLPELRRGAKIDAPVDFFGGAEVSGQPSDFHPLHIVPIQVSFR